MQQEIRDFGSVTISVGKFGEVATLTVHRPEELHLHQDDWDSAVRWLTRSGFAAPLDDPDWTEGGTETYLMAAVRQSVVLS